MLIPYLSFFEAFLATFCVTFFNEILCDRFSHVKNLLTVSIAANCNWLGRLHHVWGRQSWRTAAIPFGAGSFGGEGDILKFLAADA